MIKHNGAIYVEATKKPKLTWEKHKEDGAGYPSRYTYTSNAGHVIETHIDEKSNQSFWLYAVPKKKDKHGSLIGTYQTVQLAQEAATKHGNGPVDPRAWT